VADKSFFILYMFRSERQSSEGPKHVKDELLKKEKTFINHTGRIWCSFILLLLWRARMNQFKFNETFCLLAHVYEMFNLILLTICILGVRGSTILEAGRSRVSNLYEVIEFFNWPKPSRYTMAAGSTQPPI
jgi:hypothetical protein